MGRHTYKKVFLVVRPLTEGGEVNPLATKKILFFYEKDWPEPHETQEKEFKKMHVMFSAGQYQSTENGYE